MIIYFVNLPVYGKLPDNVTDFEPKLIVPE